MISYIKKIEFLGRCTYASRDIKKFEIPCVFEGKLLTETEYSNKIVLIERLKKEEKKKNGNPSIYGDIIKYCVFSNILNYTGLIDPTNKNGKLTDDQSHAWYCAEPTKENESNCILAPHYGQNKMVLLSIKDIKKDEMVTLEQDSSAIKDQDTKAPFDLDKRGAAFVKDQK